MTSIKAFIVALGFGGACATQIVSPRAIAADTSDANKPLGDLTNFMTVAKDAQAIAKGGDFAKARIRVKDLEKAWDDAEDQFKAINANGWKDADRKIDKTLDKLRDMKPDQAAVNESFDILLATLTSLHKPKS